MALDDAAQILVGYGNRVTESVEEDGVGGLRTHSTKSQQAAAKGGCRGCRQGIEGAGEFRIEHGDECLEGGSLAGVKAGRTDELL
jgi:hypothetical protein